MDVYERQRKVAQKDKAERDVWLLFLKVGARVSVVMEVDLVNRRSRDDRVRLTMPGTVFQANATRVLVLLDDETSEPMRNRVAEREAAIGAKLRVPYAKTFAFEFGAGWWNLATIEPSFEAERGFIAFTREMAETLLDAYPPGTRIRLDAWSETKEATKPESPVFAIATKTTPGDQSGATCEESLRRLRARTLTQTPMELELAVSVHPGKFAISEIGLAIRECTYRRMPVLMSQPVGPNDKRYILDLAPDPSTLLREFRASSPPEVASSDILWQFVDTFL